MNILQNLREFIAPFLDEIGAFIIDIQIVPGDKRKVLQIFVDTDTGITIDQCTQISRQIGAALELQDSIQDSYVLQVSSPGLKKPLLLLRQYRKNIGRRFRVRFQRDNKDVNILATLNAVDGELLTFATDQNESYRIPFNEIIESIEELPW
jgi:ribosome maturation factor RimP